MPISYQSAYCPTRWGRAIRRCRAGAMLLGFLVLGGLPASALAEADVRVVVDVSASMGRADPDNLRGRALGVLLRSLPDDGSAGVWTYGQYVNMLVKYGASDDLWKETAAIRTANLASVGRRANLVEAVDRATWDRHAPDGPAHLVLLTDGHLDVSDDPDENAAAEARLLEELAPELSAAGYRVHTLALSAAADIERLARLAAATGGHHGQITSANELSADLVALLGWVAGTAAVEVDARGTFRVAPGTRELTVLKLGDGMTGDTRLVTPAGEALSPRTPRERVRWHLDEHYEMVSLDRPAPGAWRFEGSTRGIRVHAYGDLSMTYPDLPATLFPAALRTFDLVLTSAQGPVRDAAFLDLLDVSARLQGSDGSVPVVVEPGEEGKFRVNLQNLRGRGDYVLETRLQAPTFTHRLSLPLVLDNPVSVEIHPAERGFLLWAQVRAHELDHRTLRLATLVRHPPAAAKLIPGEKLPAGLWRAAVEGSKGLVEVVLHLRGNYLNGREFEMKTDPIRVVLPVTEVQYLDMDLRGRPLLADSLPTGQDPVTQAPPEPEPAVPLAPAQSVLPPVDPGLAVPVWFVLLVGAGNVMLVMVLWWMLGTRGRFPDLTPDMARLRKLAELHPPGTAAA